MWLWLGLLLWLIRSAAAAVFFRLLRRRAALCLATTAAAGRLADCLLHDRKASASSPSHFGDRLRFGPPENGLDVVSRCTGGLRTAREPAPALRCKRNQLGTVAPRGPRGVESGRRSAAERQTAGTQNTKQRNYPPMTTSSRARTADRWNSDKTTTLKTITTPAARAPRAAAPSARPSGPTSSGPAPRAPSSDPQRETRRPGPA